MKIKAGEVKSGEPNDRTGEGEAEEDKHDWSGLDVGRGNKFQSGGGLGQGQGGDKGYKYDEDGNPIEEESGEDEDLEDEELDDPFDLDMPKDKKRAPGESKGGKKKKKASGGEEGDESGLDLDGLLGNPAEDPEWETGASAFEKITLDITVKRANAPDMSDVSLLERQGMDLLLDAPASAYQLGEKFTFGVQLGQKGKKKSLSLVGVLKSTEPVEGSRVIILVAVAEVSKPHLVEIQTVFEDRQAQLLKFLREAKG
jgi:hypothetical protein